MTLHHRQSIRMKKYDYASEGAYFLTICSYNREMILDSDPVKEIIFKIWKDLPDRFSNIRLDEFVVMPNHVHGIIWITHHYSRTVGDIIRVFKSLSAISINRYLGRKGVPVWQRNYYDRMIRDERELFLTRQYIIDNPKNWGMDSENIK